MSYLLHIANEFGNALMTVTCVYLFASLWLLLYKLGYKWVLFSFVGSLLLIVTGVGLKTGWAWAARDMATTGTYHPFMHEWRWLVNMVAGLSFFAGTIIFDNELREVKKYPKQLAIWVGVFLISLVLALT